MATPTRITDHLRQALLALPGQHDEAGVRVAVAVDRRAAIRAEVAAQGAAAFGRAVVVAPGLPLRDAEALARHDGVDRAAGPGGFLAVEAVAGAQRADGRGDRVANGAAEAAAGKQSAHCIGS